MYILTKFFSNSQFQKEFMNGSLYLSSMSEFTKIPSERALKEAADAGDRTAREQLDKLHNDDQRDVFEGTVADFNRRHVEWLPKDMKDVTVCDLKARAAGYQYCNIQCFCRMNCRYDYDSAGRFRRSWNEPDMSSFGDHAVIIMDQEEFVRRVVNAAKAAGCQVICGPVNYHPLMDGDKETVSGRLCTVQSEDAVPINDLLSDANVRCYDAFDKWDKFKKQNEWRIVINNNQHSDKFYRLEVGPLDDIARKVKVKNLATTMNRLLAGFKIKNSVDGYIGNITREAMRDEFYHMGEDKAYMLAVLGCAEYLQR